MAERRRGVQRLAVLQELRASYGIKVKGGSCPPAARTHGATAAEVGGRRRCWRPEGGASRAPAAISGRPSPRGGGGAAALVAALGGGGPACFRAVAGCRFPAGTCFIKRGSDPCQSLT